MSQTYAPGDTITGEFPISSATGAAVNADSTPTLLLYQNGTVTGVSVSSANPSTGRYTWSATLPGGYSARDEIRIEASATVGGIALPATTVFRCRLDAAVSSRSSHSADDVWAVGSRTLTAISDSAGVTTLLTRLSSTRAIYLDALQYVTDARLTWLERLGTGLEETSTGSGIWRWTTLALSRLGVDVTAIRAKTDALPADPASNAQVNTRMASFTYTTPPTVTEISNRIERSGGPLATYLAQWATMVQTYGAGLYRFITGSLTQAPTGSGGGGSAGSTLVFGPLRLILEGAGTDAVLSLVRGSVITCRATLVDESGQAIPTTGCTLSARIVGVSGNPLIADLDITEVLGDAGLVEVLIPTDHEALVTTTRARLIVTRTNGASDITSYPAQLLLED